MNPRLPTFYGWRIVAVAFLTHCITTGIVFYSFGVFLNPLGAHFGWSRAQVSFGFSLVTLCGALYSPLVGRVIDRYGARPAQLCGAFAMATGFLLLRGIQSLTQFYLVMGLAVSLGSTALGALPSNSAVARWFVRRRGQALGIATAGISMGGVIFVPLTQWLLDRYGWGTAVSVLAAVIVTAVVPPVALFMRRSPESMGLRPDGEPAVRGSGLDLEQEIERSWTPAQAVRHRNFWLITAAFGLTVMGISATLLHEIAFLLDRGLSTQQSSWILGLTAGVGVVGKIGFGSLLDRFGHRRVIMWCFGLQGIGMLLLLAPTTSATLALFVALYGFAMGGNATMQATVLGEAFGRVHYASIAGWMNPFIVVVQAAGVPLVGAVRDATGSYVPAFTAIALGSGLAVACIARLDLGRAPEA